MKIKTILACLLYVGFVSCGGHSHSGESHAHTESADHSNCTDDHNHENKGDEGRADHNHDHSLSNANHENDHNHEGECTGHDHVGASNDEHGHDDLIELCPEIAKAAGVTTAPATVKSTFNTIPAIGEILPMQGEIMTVTAKNEGFVTFDMKRILSGTSVGNGEKIMVITTQGITQENYTEQVLQAEIAYNNAKSVYERNQELVKDQLVSKTEFQNSEAIYKAAELKYKNLKSGFEKHGLRVSAPAAGYVTDMYVNEGDFVSVGQPLFTISQNRNVMLRAEVSPEYMSLLPGVVSANFRTSASAPFRSVADLGGRLTSYGRSVESTSLLVPVYFSIPYSTDYPAGSYAEIKLLYKGGESNIAVPKEAIVEDFGHYFVYVADEHGYERRDVRIGGSDGVQTEILSGLREGEEIVVTGATRIKLVERLGSMGAEAAHAGHSH